MGENLQHGAKDPPASSIRDGKYAILTISHDHVNAHNIH